MYCGACMRDNALVRAIRALGHDAILLPLYTPLTTDQPDQSNGRVFFGGLNVFLQHTSAIFRKIPAWLDRPLDASPLLRLAGRFAAKTQPSALGELTISVLRGEEGSHAKELNRLLGWMSSQPRPDAIILSNALLCGLAARLKQTLGAPVICTLQGEDFFLDSLPESHREKAWSVLRERAADINGFIAVSRYYADVMSQRLSLPAEKVRVVYNGIDVAGYEPLPLVARASLPANASAGTEARPTPTVGFLARMAPEKGLHTLIDAFEAVHAKIPDVRLRIAGSKTPGDEPFVKKMTEKLKSAGLLPQVEFLPNLSRQKKIEFLQSLDVLSVPAEYGESFGLYVLEALACGVPVVQPRHAAFPELLEATGGGILYAPGRVDELAEGIYSLLKDPRRRAALGAAGRASVLARFTQEQMARDVIGVVQAFAGARADLKTDSSLQGNHDQRSIS